MKITEISGAEKDWAYSTRNKLEAFIEGLSLNGRIPTTLDQVRVFIDEFITQMEK